MRGNWKNTIWPITFRATANFCGQVSEEKKLLSFIAHFYTENCVYVLKFNLKLFLTAEIGNERESTHTPSIRGRYD